MSELTIGTRIARKFNKIEIHGDGIKRGKVIALPQKDPLNGRLRVYVEWDKGWTAPVKEEVYVDSLLLEKEADELYDALQKEFDALSENIKNLLANASASISSANQLANNAGYNLRQLYDLTDPLMSSLRNSGWSTSSMSC